MASALDAPHFHNEDAAFDYVESHLWPNGPTCPHCGNAAAAKIGRLAGKTTRAGLRKCYACRKPFTVRMGTIFEDSHCPLRLWLQAIYLLCSSKKGFSTRQLQRTLSVGLKTAWFLGHRIRMAMDPSAAGETGPLGGVGKIVEADETYLGRSPKTRKPKGHVKNARRAVTVFALVERGGEQRSMLVDQRNVRAALAKHLDPDSKLVSDSSTYYRKLMPTPEQHEAVDHSKYEWKRGDAHTNTLEGFFSILKRGLVGVYQHVDTKHLDRYLAEFDFRQNNRARLGISDEARTANAVRGTKGKRLTYETTRQGWATV